MAPKNPWKKRENEAFQRKLIDVDTLERGKRVLEVLRNSLGDGNSFIADSIPIASPAPLSPALIPSTVPQLDSSEQVPSRMAASVLDPSESPPVLTAHALDPEDRDGDSIASRAQPMQPSPTWSKWLSAFMEEKNIQWGELIGGLMIVCCSAALVISFWQHIASRPWLKFSIFTGINAAILGLGLNAWYRWKLPTTSQGILMIGMMLVPLNFLAFAIFTLGMEWDILTVIGERLRLRSVF